MYLKAFIAGFSFPAIVLPFVYTALYLSGNAGVRTTPLQFLVFFTPFVFGCGNMLSVRYTKAHKKQDKNKIRWMTGILIGLLFACVEVFVLRLPEVLFGFTEPILYAPLVCVPIAFGLVWRYVIKQFNHSVGLNV